MRNETPCVDHGPILYRSGAVWVLKWEGTFGTIEVEDLDKQFLLREAGKLGVYPVEVTDVAGSTR